MGARMKGNEQMVTITSAVTSLDTCSTTLIRRLHAVSQESRLAIFELLVGSGAEGLCVGDIQHRLNISPAVLTFHLKTLSNAQLIIAHQRGRYTYYTPSYKAMSDVIRYLVSNCSYNKS